jgi:hypothetical protein
MGVTMLLLPAPLTETLVMDYGKKLAKNGMTCNVLAPLGNRNVP